MVISSLLYDNSKRLQKEKEKNSFLLSLTSGRKRAERGKAPGAPEFLRNHVRPGKKRVDLFRPFGAPACG